jgi:hypothetical protein
MNATGFARRVQSPKLLTLMFCGQAFYEPPTLLNLCDLVSRITYLFTGTYHHHYRRRHRRRRRFGSYNHCRHYVLATNFVCLSLFYAVIFSIKF